MSGVLPVKTDADRVLWLMSALNEIIHRLEDADVESSLSIAKSARNLVVHGANSPEWLSFNAIEKARLADA